MITDGKNQDPDWASVKEIVKHTRHAEKDTSLFVYQIAGNKQGY